MLGAIWGFLWGTIPWQFWLIAGIAGSVAIAILVPGRLGLLGGCALLIVTLSTAAYSRGWHNGAASEKEWWVEQANLEEQRLTKEFSAALIKERERAEAAEASLATTEKERDDAIKAASQDPNAGRVVIPEPLARRLCDIGGPDGCADSEAQRPQRPGPLRRVLPRHR